MDYWGIYCDRCPFVIRNMPPIRDGSDDAVEALQCNASTYFGLRLILIDGHIDETPP